MSRSSGTRGSRARATKRPTILPIPPSRPAHRPVGPPQAAPASGDADKCPSEQSAGRLEPRIANRALRAGLSPAAVAPLQRCEQRLFAQLFPPSSGAWRIMSAVRSPPRPAPARRCSPPRSGAWSGEMQEPTSSPSHRQAPLKERGIPYRARVAPPIGTALQIQSSP